MGAPEAARSRNETAMMPFCSKPVSTAVRFRKLWTKSNAEMTSTNDTAICPITSPRWKRARWRSTVRPRELLAHRGDRIDDRHAERRHQAEENRCEHGNRADERNEPPVHREIQIHRTHRSVEERDQGSPRQHRDRHGERCACGRNQQAFNQASATRDVAARRQSRLVLRSRVRGRLREPTKAWRDCHR